MFLEKDDLKLVLHYYAKILTDDPGNKESELIKAASCMALFRYLSEADGQDEGQLLTAMKVKEMTNLDVKQILSLFLDYNFKYPELLEFPNGVQNIMTIFY